MHAELVSTKLPALRPSTAMQQTVQPHRHQEKRAICLMLIPRTADLRPTSSSIVWRAFKPVLSADGHCVGESTWWGHVTDFFYCESLLAVIAEDQIPRCLPS